MRIGIVGTWWGRMHVGGFRRAGAEVVAICGRDPERTRRVAAQEGIPLACDGGPGWQASVSAGYEPARGGWSVSPVRVFDDGRGRELGPALEPREEELEPWAAAHVETARHFLAAAQGSPSDRLASFQDGALVQRVLGAALAADEAGHRVGCGARPLPW
jgi:predicted dehydrogenase